MNDGELFAECAALERYGRIWIISLFLIIFVGAARVII